MALQSLLMLMLFAPLDNLPAGKTDWERSFTGTWTTSTQSGYYGIRGLVSNISGSTYKYEFSVPASGSHLIQAWWTASTNRCPATQVTVYDVPQSPGPPPPGEPVPPAVEPVLLATVTVNQQINGSKWIDLGTWSFPSGKAAVVFTVPAGGKYVNVDGINPVVGAPTVEPSDPPPDDPPPDDPPPITEPLIVKPPSERLFASWSPVTQDVQGGACTVTEYELAATPASLDLRVLPAPDPTILRRVPVSSFSGVDCTDLIVSATKTDWRVWVRAYAGTARSAWSNPLEVTYDPGMPLPIQPAAPTGLTLTIQITVG